MNLMNMTFSSERLIKIIKEEVKMKKVLVTGGTQGVGLETTKILLDKGYEVHITYRKSATVAEELEAKYPGKLFAHKLDQGKLEEIENADFLSENEWYGVVFNAALGSGTVKDYAEQGDPLKAKNDIAMMTVNALGPLWIYKKMESMLLAKPEKTKLVFLSSVGGGIACFPKFTLSDGMSKCAVAYLAKQLAAENTHTLIDVFCISPGAIETPMFYSSTLKNMSPEERKAFDKAQAKERLIQPEEIATLIVELMRDESTLLHGCNIDATMGLGVRPGIQTEAGLEHN